MRWLILVLLALPAWAQHERQYRNEGPPRTSRLGQSDWAFFEAFPTNGTGTSGVCSTTAPTGTRGEALTFTRASNGTCTKTAAGGLATTGIADGDLVVLSSNVARVEYDSNGVLGLLVEAARTNSTLRSEEFDNVYWTNDVAPTANAAVAPDGATTAERFVFAATGVGARSISFVSGGCPTAGTASATLYVKGVSGSGTMDLCQSDLGAGSCTSCSFVSGSWTRCAWTKAAVAPGYFAFGNATLYNGGTTRTQSDVYVWGAQCEAGAYATSYIPTAGATVTRAAEVARFAKSVPTTAGFCSAATVTSPSTASFPSGSGLWAPGLSSGTSIANTPYIWPYTAGVGTQMSIDGTSSSAAPSSYSGAQNPDTSSRHIASNTGSLWRICKNSTCATTAAGAWASPTYSHIHLVPNAGNEGAHVWSRLVVDPDYTKCGP